MKKMMVKLCMTGGIFLVMLGIYLSAISRISGAVVFPKYTQPYESSLSGPGAIFLGIVLLLMAWGLKRN